MPNSDWLTLEIEIPALGRNCSRLSTPGLRINWFSVSIESNRLSWPVDNSSSYQFKHSCSSFILYSSHPFITLHFILSQFLTIKINLFQQPALCLCHKWQLVRTTKKGLRIVVKLLCFLKVWQIKEATMRNWKGHVIWCNFKPVTWSIEKPFCSNKLFVISLGKTPRENNGVVDTGVHNGVVGYGRCPGQTQTC